MRSALLLVGLADASVPEETETGTGTGADAETGTGSSLHRVAKTVAPAVEDLVVACPDDQCSAVTDALEDVPHRFAVDPAVGENPVAAIRAGARVATGCSVAVVASHAQTVDTRLLEECFESCETAAVPCRDSWLYPLQAVYDTAAVRTACDRTLATGPRRLLDVLVRLDDVTVVDAPELAGDDEATSRRTTPTTTPASVVGS